VGRKIGLASIIALRMVGLDAGRVMGGYAYACCTVGELAPDARPGGMAMETDTREPPGVRCETDGESARRFALGYGSKRSASVSRNIDINIPLGQQYKDVGQTHTFVYSNGLRRWQWVVVYSAMALLLPQKGEVIRSTKAY
jgi:hypothetical protein